MKVTDFDFPLPESLIALKPVIPRDECRLLVLHRDGTVEHRRFRNIGEYLNKGDLLLLNNTKVFPARLVGTKQTGGRIEVLLVREIEPDTWEIMSRERYTGKIGFRPEPIAPFTLEGEIFDGKIIKFNRMSIMEIIWKIGQMPLPPYIKRKPQEADREWYQTVYAEKPGSIAAPTAGLHFTEGLITELGQKGVLLGSVTLHVGTGTFKPIRVSDVENHVMDEEYFEIDNSLIETIKKVKESGKRVVSVGTTTTRATEGVFSGRYKGSNNNGCIKGTTDIFIYPGYRFRVVDSLITNFHLPRSTPLMLTSALAGTWNLLNAYNCAISMGYRFFSYGDAMLII
ncbi:MAG: tRNA preQ1(34) S-adenosylmethionine ribosyltransferase-isomerase QueA [Thermodesulfovibrionales bacterium]